MPWRILFTSDPDECVSTAEVIGAEVTMHASFKEDQRRVQALEKGGPKATSLAASMLKFSEAQKPEKQQPLKRMWSKDPPKNGHVY